jgi:hypothetical protein
MAERPIALPPEGGRSGKMRGFLAEHLGVFDPDDIRILVSALDKAWEAVLASGVVFTRRLKPNPRGRLLRDILLRPAKQGERDQGRLRDGSTGLCASKSRTFPLAGFGFASGACPFFHHGSGNRFSLAVLIQSGHGAKRAESPSCQRRGNTDIAPKNV